jgi:hypothetical protein
LHAPATIPSIQSTHRRLRAARCWLIAATLAPLGLSGCDMLGIESATVIAARKEAEGKAIGAGCRHAARSVEQCYSQNKKADKAAVFTGWKEMNEYMAENKIEAVPAPPDPVDTAVASADEAEPDDKKAPKAAAKKQ